MKATSTSAFLLFGDYLWTSHADSSFIRNQSKRIDEYEGPGSNRRAKREPSISSFTSDGFALMPPTSNDNAPCGNGLCDEDEDASTCMEDCRDLRLTTADTGGSKGSYAYIFSIRPLRDVTITSFDIYTRTAMEDQLVEVYTRVGTYSGYELAQDGWELVFNDSSIELKGGSTPTFLEGIDVYVPADTVQSFYIYVPNKIRYTKEGTFGDGRVYRSDDVLEVHEGVGVRNDKFGSGIYSEDVMSPRAFTGSIR